MLVVTMARKGRSNLTGISKRRKERNRQREKRAQERDHTAKFAGILFTALSPTYATNLIDLPLKDQDMEACSSNGANQCSKGENKSLQSL